MTNDTPFVEFRANDADGPAPLGGVALAQVNVPFCRLSVQSEDREERFVQADHKDAAKLFVKNGDGGYWKRQYYKVMLEAQQAMGRNIRGSRDRGVCFLMSRGFEKFVYHGLPEWLQPAYRRGKMLDECLEDARRLLT